MEPNKKATAEVGRVPAERRIPKLIKVRAFGRYTLVARLGRGGMAEVFLGYQSGPRGFRKPIVVKKILSDLAEDPRLVQMFFDEARLAARLHHPNVVQTIDVGESDGEYFLAMEYLEGQPLSVVIKRSRRLFGSVPPRIACRVLVETLEGLHYAHEVRDFGGKPLGVVHRDVSPQNVFITYGGAVKVLDFGVAKATTQVVETRTGAVKGKYAYMAPEQGRGADVDRRADVWAAGVLLWEALMGKRLFKEKTEYATLRAVMELPIPPLSGFEEVALFQPVIDRALARDANERYKDALEMRDVLLSILEDNFARAGRTEISGFMKRLFDDVIDEHEQTLGVAMNAEEGDQGITAIGKPLRADSPEESAAHNHESHEVSAALDDFADGTVPTGPPAHSLAHAGSARSRQRKILGLVSLLVFVLFLPLGIYIGAEPEVPSTTEPTSRGEELEVEGSSEAPAARAEEIAPTATVTTERAVPEQVAEPLVVPEPRNDEAEPRRTKVRPASATRRASLGSRATKMLPAVSVARPDVSMDPVPDPEPRVQRGTLAINTRPWSDVYLRRTRLGRTPLNYDLPPGRHTLTFRNTERGITARLTVEIRAGETTRLTTAIENATAGN